MQFNFLPSGEEFVIRSLQRTGITVEALHDLCPPSMSVRADHIKSISEERLRPARYLIILLHKVSAPSQGCRTTARTTWYTSMTDLSILTAL
jgi:hypothetical protein